MCSTIVDIYGLAKELHASPNTLKKIWRSLPHFFIGTGKTLKGARFILHEVIDHLKKEAGYGSMERQKKEAVGRKIPVSPPTTQKRGVPNKVGSTAMDDQKAPGTKKSPSTRRDPFKLLPGINKIP